MKPLILFEQITPGNRYQNSLRGKKKMGGTSKRVTLGWMMITLGLLFFVLKMSLPFDIVMPGLTSALVGIAILMVGKRPKRIY